MFKKNRCPHSTLRGIYGDEINRTPGFRRLECLDCRTLLDGPVSLSWMRSGESIAAVHQPGGSE